MAWLQSSFTNHQLIGDSKANNLRKGYKVGSLNKNTDPDKSDTPLLLDGGPLLDLKTETAVTESCDNASVSEPKKTNLLHNISSKPSFLSSNFFDRSGSVVKTKPLPDVRSPTQPSSGFVNKPKEGKNLLSFGKSEKPQVEDDEDDDSEDDWFSPHASRGYQRVKTGAD